MKTKLIKLIYVSFISALFFLIIALSLEIFFRFSGKYPLAGFQLNDNDLWRIEKSIHENKETEEGTSFILTIAPNGFRGPLPSPEKTKAIKRILILGDSYTAGLGYPDHQIFTSIFSDLLNNDSSLHQKFEIINTGIPAWSIDQEWKYFIEEGINFHPDYVLIVASPNDIREAYCKKFVTLDAHDSLVVHPPHFILKKKLGWYLSAHSSLFLYLQKKVFHSNYGTMSDLFEMYPLNFGKEEQRDWDRPLYLKNPFKEVLDAQKLYEKLLSGIQQKCLTDKIPFGVCLNVVLTQFDSTYANDSACDVHVVGNYFSSLTNQLNIPFLNSGNPASWLTYNPKELFMQNDYHYSAKGHLFVAKELYDFFKRDILLKPDTLK